MPFRLFWDFQLWGEIIYEEHILVFKPLSFYKIFPELRLIDLTCVKAFMHKKERSFRKDFADVAMALTDNLRLPFSQKGFWLTTSGPEELLLNFFLGGGH